MLKLFIIFMYKVSNKKYSFSQFYTFHSYFNVWMQKVSQCMF